jgi:ribose transport system ATP-binding protein
LENLASRGVLIILVSSDLQELIRLSTRLIVIRKGRIAKEFTQGTVTQNDILAVVSGLERGAESHG